MRIFPACLLLAAALLVPWAAAGQPLPRGNLGEDRARIYRPDTQRWERVTVAVTDGTLILGADRVPVARITSATYERRRGGFRGALRPPRVRHVLTVHVPGTFYLVELGKDIAGLVANQLQAAGAPLETRDGSS